MKVDLKPLELLRVGKLITIRDHWVDESLHIYNYTHRVLSLAPEEWSAELKTCRGLILDNEGNVIARPWDKWFNQNKENPHKGEFVAYDKLDGSLGILYPFTDKRGVTRLAIATRGSFKSSQAGVATRLLGRYISSRYVKQMLMQMVKKYTLMFEVIYPDNRIVVDYKDSQSLVFLGAREIESGKVLLPDEVPEVSEWFTCARRVENPYQIRDNAEGCVLYYTDGFMEKIKYDEYVRIHKLVTTTSSVTIWDNLRNGLGLDELLAIAPLDFAKWVKEEAAKLNKKFESIEKEYVELFKPLAKLENRKEFAMQAKMTKYPQLLFAMADGKNYKDLIWKIIKPEYQRPFKEEV